MKKRGQLTIFVLASIIILLIIIGFFFLTSKEKTTSLDDEYWQTDAMSQKISNLKDIIDDCIYSITKESLILVAFQGGYYKPPMQKFSFEPIFFPYYYYEGQITFPKIKDIEIELSNSVDDKIIECLDSRGVEGLRLDYRNPNTRTRIIKENAHFEIDMPIRVSTKERSTTIELKDFPINHNSSLYEIYEIAEYITLSHREDSEYHCTSCITEMAQERDLYVYFFPYMLNDLITGVMIYENRTGINNPYTYIFLNKYTGNEITPKLQV